MEATRHRVGLVGAGEICPHHAGALAAAGIDLLGVCDRDRARGRAMASRLGTRFAEGMAELVDRGASVIHVLTPPEAHLEVALEAIERGCHVLVEKPLATDAADGARMRDAARDKGVALCVDHSLLFDPEVRRALAAIRAGAVGRVVGAEVVRASTYPPYGGGPLPPHYRRAGHPFRDLGVHALYLLRELLGAIDGVEASWRSLGGNPNLAFDEWTALVRCRRGSGTVRLSWNARPLASELVVYGTAGSLRVDLFAMTRARRPAFGLGSAADRVFGAAAQALSPLPPLVANAARFALGRVRPYQGVRDLVAEFHRALAAGDPMPVAIDDAIEVVRWCEEVARAAEREHAAAIGRFAVSESVPFLVTGASGGVGGAVVARLLARGERVRCLVRRADAELPAGVERVVGDLGDPEAVARAVRGASTVVHAGAAMHGGAAEHDCATVAGTANVIDACLAAGAKKLVHVSSLSVLQLSHGEDGAVVSEHTPLEPSAELRGHYTRAKLEAERLVRRAVEERRLAAVILRPGQIFGGPIPALTPAVARRVGDFWCVLGDGEQRLPLVYLDDVVDAILLAADGGLARGETIHLTDGEAVTQNELLERVLGKDAPVLRVPRALLFAAARAGDAAFGAIGLRSPLPAYRLRSALAQRQFRTVRAEPLLGWRPRVGVRAGIERTVAR